GRAPAEMQGIYAQPPVVQAGPDTANLCETPLSPVPRSVPKDPMPEQIGRYRILERIGAGGMGTVYRAEDLQLQRIVALKIPHFGGADECGELARQRFLREARAAAAIRHPNVCPIYDVGEHEGLPYVVMA